MSAADSDPTDLRTTPLDARHRALGARMVPFAGYAMPVQYAGILAEHLHTRDKAGLFDVSHMGQVFLVGPDHATTAAALEALVPADIVNLAPGAQRYSQFLTETGGIVDDLMIHRSADPADDGRLFLVVNAGRKEIDYALLRAHLPPAVAVEVADDRALLALQGPLAVTVLTRSGADVTGMPFMTAGPATIAGIPCHVSRSGYTGEDGFEISVLATRAGELWDALLAEPEVAPVGLGARDSLRLEAGLCLHGHDINETTTPVEANLVWSIQKRRRAEGGFRGDGVVLREIAEGPKRRRVGLRLEGRAPAREGTPILSAAGADIGTVTSGGFGPSVGAPIAMGYVAAAFAAPGTPVQLLVRGKPLAATVAALPFVPARFVRKPA
ncbi:glycine cleavage system aminomethyltransferase GcvT [Methylobrevis albus]|uniref:aminomethyltransferase n=1 Tax=Methylobrevis albus TaxID=2793297 RepID=A0A931HZT7_9HYPH|nr:glycine cleavage system aminomethyltransferase GcvT [Methylobrevis albus]MBH0237132.1 glycine cleavage system aminomethyltransferase GcvT [Methylobrevis albus]